MNSNPLRHGLLPALLAIGLRFVTFCTWSVQWSNSLNALEFLPLLVGEPANSASRYAGRSVLGYEITIVGVVFLAATITINICCIKYFSELYWSGARLIS